jgi:hypothetical protein
MSSSVPRLIATVGLHGSASTYVFNVVRELVVATVGTGNVLALSAEDVSELFSQPALENRYVVLKSHRGGAGWDALIWLTQAPVFVSIRDPRDAALSLALRFNEPLDKAVQALGADCRRAVRCADAGQMVLRYEDRFFEDRGLPAQWAEKLGLAVDPAVCRSVAHRYSTAEVRSFAAALGELPPDQVIKTAQTRFDRVTQIHRTHIGDARVGKWRELLAPDARAQITRYFEPFLARFGYEI